MRRACKTSRAKCSFRPFFCVCANVVDFSLRNRDHCFFSIHATFVVYSSVCRSMQTTRSSIEYPGARDDGEHLGDAYVAGILK